MVSDGLFMPEFAVYCEGGALISPFSAVKVDPGHLFSGAAAFYQMTSRGQLIGTPVIHGNTTASDYDELMALVTQAYKPLCNLPGHHLITRFSPSNQWVARWSQTNL